MITVALAIDRARFHSDSVSVRSVCVYLCVVCVCGKWRYDVRAWPAKCTVFMMEEKNVSTHTHRTLVNFETRR